MINSVICVPAIGADARKTWSGTGEEGIGWLGSLQRKLPSANVLLYDHLEPGERRLELKHARDAATAKEFAAAEAALASFGVDEYAERFRTDVWSMQHYKPSGDQLNPTQEHANSGAF